jgi:hypothetical protein
MITMRSIIGGVRNALASQQRQRVRELQIAGAAAARHQEQEENAEGRWLAEMAAQIMRRQAKVS